MRRRKTVTSTCGVVKKFKSLGVIKTELNSSEGGTFVIAVGVVQLSSVFDYVLDKRILGRVGRIIMDEYRKDPV
jgi:hypothetical protein